MPLICKECKKKGQRVKMPLKERTETDRVYECPECGHLYKDPITNPPPQHR